MPVSDRASLIFLDLQNQIYCRWVANLESHSEATAISLNASGVDFAELEQAWALLVHHEAEVGEGQVYGQREGGAPL